MTVLDELAALSRASALLCGFSLEVHMNQQTVDELTLRAGRMYRWTGADAISGVRIVIDNDLPWNISEWVKRKRFTVISCERVPVFPPDPIRDLEGKVVVP